MGNSDYDVAIVGASIAGCAAATFLGRQGARVALVESHSDPAAYKRMCTHAIQASAVSTVERLGLRDALTAAGARRGELNLWTRYGWISPSRAYTRRLNSPELGLNVRRETLDPMLRELAARTDGVELLLGHTASSLVRDGKRVGGIVTRTRDGNERELRAKLVVAADGRNSTVAKLAGQRTRLKPNNRFCYMAYYQDTPLLTGSSAQVWFTDPDIAYAFPTDNGLTLLCAVPCKDRLEQFKEDPEAGIARLFEPLPDAPRVDPGKRVSKVMGKLDVPTERRRPAQDGTAYVGDAALAADPVWGLGMSWALQSAEWLADEVGPALADGAGVDRALKAYARRHRRATSAHNALSASYSSGRGFNPLEKLLYRGAARDDELAGRLALFGERWIKPQQLLTPATVGRMLRVNLRPTSQPHSTPAPTT
jgi:menaquinone-9 beta-reductase